MKKAMTKFLVVCLCAVMLIGAIPMYSSAEMYGYVDSSIKGVVFDADYYLSKHADVKTVIQSEETKESNLYWHYAKYGVAEGRVASPVFDVADYLNLNADLLKAFGKGNYTAAIKHFAEFGLNKDSNRVTTDNYANIGTNTSDSKFLGRIRLQGTELCLSVSGTNVQLAQTALNDETQMWLMSRNSDGTYTIINKATGKALDLQSCKRANGSNIQVYTPNGTEAQKWAFVKRDDGPYSILLKTGSGRVLDVAGGKKSVGTNIQLYQYNGTTSQAFYVDKLKTIETMEPVNLGGTFYSTIVATKAGLNLGYNGKEVEIQDPAAANSSDAVAQMWKFYRQSSGAYTIMNMRTGLVLTVENNSPSNNANVIMDKNGSEIGKSWFIYKGDTGYILVPQCSTGGALDVINAGKTAGTQLQTYTFSTSNEAQNFTIPKDPGYYADYSKNANNELGTDFYAYIQGTNSNKNLAVSGTSVQLKTADKSTSQLWKFTKNSNGTYTIMNMETGKVLDVKGAATSNSTPVQVYQSNGSMAQQWYIYNVNGEYIFIPRNAQGSALDVSGNRVADGTPIDIYYYNRTSAQKFKINKIEGSYLQNANPSDIGTNFYANLQIGSYQLGVNGSNVQLVSSGNGSYWKFERQSDGKYKIIDVGTGKVLDLAGGKLADGTNIQVYTSNNTTAQRWWVYNMGGSITIASAKNVDYVVDLSGGKTTLGRNIQLYSYNGTPAQQFKIANKTDKVLNYYVASPYNTGKIGTYNDLNSAKNVANSKSYLGYVVFDTFNKVVYCPTGTLNTAKIMWNAQLVSDFARDNGFVYGHSIINPAFNWKNLSISGAVNPGQRTTSCDRFCDWVLYRSGFTQGQKYNYGHCVFEMAGWLSSIGFTRISNPSQLRAGDVVFTTYDPTRPGTPAHVYLNASANYGGNVYLRYDHGSNARIRCQKGNEVIPGNQPFKEHVGDFYYAYRPY